MVTLGDRVVGPAPLQRRPQGWHATRGWGTLTGQQMVYGRGVDVAWAVSLRDLQQPSHHAEQGEQGLNGYSGAGN